MDSRTFAEQTIAAMQAGDFVADANEMKREPVLKIWATITADRQAVRELLRQSLDCCAVLPSGKLEVLEKERLADLHKQADELRKRAAHNDEVLDRFDAAHMEALADNPGLEPSIYALRTWKKAVTERITGGKNCIRTSSATWLASTEGSIYTAETIKNHPRVAREIAKYQPIIDAGEKELPLAEAHLRKAEAILSEAILPEKVDVIPAPNAFNQAIGRATAL
jgi:hypothetical protein